MVRTPLRVLIADDTPDIRMLLRTTLEADGRFEVVGEAADGGQAIEVAGATLPDVVVLDLAMPVMDGLQAIGPILETSPESKIVILSGFNSAEMAPEALDRGAHAYLEKGVSGPQVVDALLQVAGVPAEAEAAVSVPDLTPASGGEGHLPVAPTSPPPADVSTSGQEIDEVLAALVHEVMTPLTVIQGFSETLVQRLEGLPPEMIREAALGIARNADQMARLIASFADARRMEVEELDLYLESVDLADFVHQTIVDLAYVTTGRPVRTELEGGIRVKVDKTRIRQVIHNLVMNVVKYTPPGSAIDVSVFVADGSARVSISDHGPGIPPAAAETVFSKFAQLGPRTSGAGLGLYIARTIARAHGGEVVLSASPSGGACFTVRLPLRD